MKRLAVPALLMVACSPAASSPTVAGPPEATVPRSVDAAGAVALTIGPIEQGPGWRTYVRVRIQNASDEWLWLSYGLGGKPGSDLWFDVVNTQGGAAAPWSCAERTEASGSAPYMLLSPGSEYATRVSIDCYAVSSRGPWRIQAHYRGKDTRPPPPPRAVAWFAGEATSNVIEYVPAEGYPGLPQ